MKLQKNFKGTVVQLVGALPCHGRSCGFESRQSRTSEFQMQFFKLKCDIKFVFILVHKMESFFFSLIGFFSKLNKFSFYNC